VPEMSEECAKRERLLREQLREGEEVDGVFILGGDASTIITSERILMGGTSGATSWAMAWAIRSIPWKLVTGVEFGEFEEPGQIQVRVAYNDPGLAKRGPTTTTERTIDWVCTQDADAEVLCELINARIGAVAAHA